MRLELTSRKLKAGLEEQPGLKLSTNKRENQVKAGGWLYKKLTAEWSSKLKRAPIG